MGKSRGYCLVSSLSKQSQAGDYLLCSFLAFSPSLEMLNVAATYYQFLPFHMLFNPMMPRYDDSLLITFNGVYTA